jgi:hypothetical protein
MNCLECGINIENVHGNRKYCSVKCRNIKFLISFNKDCLFCKKEFRGRKNQKYCNSSCFAKNRTDHLTRIQQAKRKYPKIDGLSRGQVFRKFNPEKMLYQLDKEKMNRTILIQFLGGICITCGYNNDIRALQLDHIHGDGKEDRLRIGMRIHRYYLNNLKEAKNKIQVLCANCHAIKTSNEISEGIYRKGK